ncbi:MAG: DUF1801 domain-containing protein [Pseudomonadota bacterium]
MDPFAPLLATWPPEARRAFATLRALCRDAAATSNAGPLDESLKWGQPAWRPRKARTGSTLRAMWDEGHPDALALYVDCKTDLAARMQALYPALPNDGRRALTVPLSPLPEDALHHLAAMTFTYHLHRRQA